MVPIAVVILTGAVLRAAAGHGAAWARSSGRSRCIWFVCIALLGVRGIRAQPGGARARSIRCTPSISSCATGIRGFAILGAVVLVVTGGEALYADMGHFGRRPIRVAWFGVVLPALMLNYFGQGALLLDDPGRGAQPLLCAGARLGAVSRWWCIATAAAVVASQALISGAFSLTQQAMQLGLLSAADASCTPRATETGQIYMPERELAAAGRLHRAGARLPVVRPIWPRPTASR